MTHAYQGHIGLHDLNSMAANAGIIKVNVTFYRIINSDTAFERHGSRIPIRDNLNTVRALKSTLFRSLASRDCRLNTASENLKSKYIICYRKQEEKATTSLSQLDKQWKLELPNTLDGTGSEMNSMYF